MPLGFKSYHYPQNEPLAPAAEAFYTEFGGGGGIRLISAGSAVLSISEERAVSSGDSRQRRTVYFRGHVQGVGFRFATQRIAANCEVEGFVRNLSDGGVLVVVEGTSQELDRFLRRLEEELSGHIRDSDMTHSVATGEFAGFDIRY